MGGSICPPCPLSVDKGSQDNYHASVVMLPKQASCSSCKRGNVVSTDVRKPCLPSQDSVLAKLAKSSLHVGCQPLMPLIAHTSYRTLWIHSTAIDIRVELTSGGARRSWNTSS
jgi:hypothetical protein